MRIQKGIPFEMLEFLDKEGRVIERRDVRLRRTQSVCVNIKKSKTDQFGKGRIVRHNRGEIGNLGRIL